MKIDSRLLNTVTRHVNHYVSTNKPNHFIKAETYHYHGKYIRSVICVECGDGFESHVLDLSRDGKSVYRVIEHCPRYSAKRLQELSALDEAEVRQVAAANDLTLTEEAVEELATA